MAVFIKNDSAFLKNVGTFEAKRRGVLKKRLGARNMIYHLQTIHPFSYISQYFLRNRLLYLSIFRNIP